MRWPTAFSLRTGVRPAILSLFVALLAAGCGDGGSLQPPWEPSVAGRVTSSAAGSPVAGAIVRVGDAVATTNADGRFALTDLTAGTATLRCTAPGFVDYETEITVTSDSTLRDIGLARIEVFEFGDYALYVPGSVAAAHGVLVALGGPDTRGFVTGKPFGAPVPEAEAALQELGQGIRELAASRGLAVFGTSLAAMENGAGSDQLLADALTTAAAQSGRPELPTAPAILYGLSGGGPEASGFAARHPAQVAGLFLKAPAGVEFLASGNTLGVPTYMVLAELDAFVDNAALTAAFEANRKAGALWALALEPGVPHHAATPVHRQTTLDWMRAIVDLRVLDGLAGPNAPIAEAAGWLGDRATGQAWRWADYPGDRKAANWFPSQATAEQWRVLAGVSP